MKAKFSLIRGVGALALVAGVTHAGTAPVEAGPTVQYSTSGTFSGATGASGNTYTQSGPGSNQLKITFNGANSVQLNDLVSGVEQGSSLGSFRVDVSSHEYNLPSNGVDFTLVITQLLPTPDSSGNTVDFSAEVTGRIRTGGPTNQQSTTLLVEFDSPLFDSLTFNDGTYSGSVQYRVPQSLQIVANQTSPLGGWVTLAYSELPPDDGGDPVGAAVPEPSTLAMALLTVPLLALRLRARARRTQVDPAA